MPYVIDVWAQLPTPVFLSQPWLQTLNRWTRKEATPPVSVDQMIASMNRARVDHALICGWESPTGTLISNEQVAEIVAKHPDRFSGAVSVDLNDPCRAAATLHYYVTEHGFKALRIVPWLWRLPPNDRRYYPLYVACCELGIPVMTQIGHTGPLCPSEPGRPIPYLDEVLLDFPELTVVGGHVGFPWMDEVMSLARKYQNFHIDTSAYVLDRLPETLVEYMRGPGASRVMFGTNFPMLTPERCLQNLETLGLNPEARDLFLGGNAMRVLGLGPVAEEQVA